MKPPSSVRPRGGCPATHFIVILLVHQFPPDVALTRFACITVALIEWPKRRASPWSQKEHPARVNRLETVDLPVSSFEIRRKLAARRLFACKCLPRYWTTYARGDCFVCRAVGVRSQRPFRSPEGRWCLRHPRCRWLHDRDCLGHVQQGDLGFDWHIADLIEGNRPWFATSKRPACR